MSCDHVLDAEYLYPSDARIADIDDREGVVVFTVVLPCPECDEALEVGATAERVVETDLPRRLEDADDRYD